MYLQNLTRLSFGILLTVYWCKQFASLASTAKIADKDLSSTDTLILDKFGESWGLSSTIGLDEDPLHLLVFVVLVYFGYDDWSINLVVWFLCRYSYFGYCWLFAVGAELYIVCMRLAGG